ncbi:MAG TPA: ABC transporter ATP-binding protein [candidate division Zixibacteria bacterium]|jgi:putative ABC transport system ATP-binding protein
MAIVISTYELCRYYRRGPQEIRAVDHVSLSIARGEFVSIVGSSGSGKSTLLNLLAGLDTPTDGDIRIGNDSLTAMTRRQRAAYRAQRVGMVFQSFNLLPYRSAVENVELALYFTQLPRRKRRDQAAAILETLGLADRMGHLPADMSGGEQQRVAIARALVKRPELLFADEPTGNLDHDNATAVAELLSRLCEQGLTVVMVTHNLDLAQHYAQRVIRMHYGAIVTTGDGSQPR